MGALLHKYFQVYPGYGLAIDGALTLCQGDVAEGHAHLHRGLYALTDMRTAKALEMLHLTYDAYRRTVTFFGIIACKSRHRLRLMLDDAALRHFAAADHKITLTSNTQCRLGTVVVRGLKTVDHHKWTTLRDEPLYVFASYLQQ